jgi:PAS domain S-box-containing protein
MLKQVEADDLDIYSVLSGILKVAVKQLEAQEGTGNIIIVTKDMEIEHAWLADGEAQEPESAHYLNQLLHLGLAGWVINNKRPDLINDTLVDKRWRLQAQHPSLDESWSVICAPFIVRSRAVGTITIQKPGRHQFDQRDLNLLTAIASQAASSIDNALLYAEQKRQLHVSALLHDASRIINSTLDINEIMQALLTQVNEVLNAEATSIALVDKRTRELVYQTAAGIGGDKIVGLRLPANQGVSGWVMEHAQPALVPDTAADLRFTTKGDEITGHPTRTIICAPIQHKDEVLGTIQAINPIQGNFNQRDLELLVNLANIASSAIVNAQQFSRAQAAERRYLNLFQDSINPILLTNTKHTIVEANWRAARFFGYEREELIGLAIEDLFPAKAELPGIARIKSGKIRSFRSEAFPKEGQPIPVEVYVKQTSLEAESELIQWQYHDLTHQVELEEMRRDLMAMLFHDLQSPLSNVMTSLEMMRFEIPEGDESALGMMLEIAFRSSNHLQALISSLLDIDRLEAGHPVGEQTAVSIHQLIDEAADMEQPDYERRGTELIRQLDDNLPHIFVEQDMIRRVLVNLLDNALRHSDGADEVTVRATCLFDEKQVLISVIDNGPGVPSRFREVIFEKFQRVQRSGKKSKGLGIGLAFCRLAVEAHGGSIWVDDASEGGARFNLTLPMAVDHE